MSQQVLDLRRTVQLARRHKRLVTVFVVLGIFVGCAYSFLKPQMLTSSALVVFPESTQSTNPASSTANGGSGTLTTTLEIIAGSNQVLSAALPEIHPALSFEQLQSAVSIGSPTTDIISVSAKAKTAAASETTANAVANSYIKYVNAPTSPIGNQSAALLQPATSASGTKPVEALIVTGFLGGLAGLLIGVIAAAAITRKDRRLRERDEIANSVGIPVLASVPTARPSDASGWTRLLQEYQPGPVQAWQLRTALRRLALPDNVVSDRGGAGSSVAILSLASDPGALALGPQLAVFAASLGIPTSLIIGPQQDENVTAALRTACAMPPGYSADGRNQLRTAVCHTASPEELPRAALTVLVMVVDGEAPQMPDTIRTATTVLGVSAGVATAEQLARSAVSAAIDGREIAGILVANPDPNDTTMGQMPRLARSAPRHRMPTRLNGITTEIRR